MNNSKEPHLPDGTLLHNGSYRIVRYISSGGFGNTYEAEHITFGDRVAIKELFISGICSRHTDKLNVTISVAENRLPFEMQKRKFFKEAVRLHRLNHPNIVRVSDVFEQNGTAYYVMDYIDGESLSTRMKRQGHPYTEEEVRHYMRPVMEALSYVHQQGLLHLDLKPGNIMVEAETDNPILIDFGASKQFESEDGKSLSSSSVMAWTPGYAPSEQMEQAFHKFGSWTDVYALGGTMLCMLTGSTPPSPTDIIDEGLPELPRVSSEMTAAIESAMNPFRKKRCQTMEALAAILAPKGVKHSEGIHSVADSDETIIANATFVPDVEETVISKPYLTPQIKKWESSISSFQKELIQSLINNMVLIEGGTFLMGSDIGQSEAENDEKPIHQVTLSSYYLGIYPVSQAEWLGIMGDNPSAHKEDNLPVENVSWEACQKFILELKKITGLEFRLPTEAEWEFAARGGNAREGFLYSGSNNPNNVAWYLLNSQGITKPISRKFANELGLYDMSGNVWEWCQDWYAPYINKEQYNPNGPITGEQRVLRGGCCCTEENCCRVAYRSCNLPFLSNSLTGLRLALNA